MYVTHGNSENTLVYQLARQALFGISVLCTFIFEIENLSRRPTVFMAGIFIPPIPGIWRYISICQPTFPACIC